MPSVPGTATPSPVPCPCWQAYLGRLPAGDKPAQTGARAVNSLGYLYQGVPMDASYYIERDNAHNKRKLVLVFSAVGKQDINEESLELDNFVARLSLGHWLYMPMIAR